MNKRALLVIDVQNDFLPGGALAVPDGDQVVPVINRLMADGDYDLIVASQDWHPPDHGSFVSQHPDHDVGDRTTLDGLEQIVWPDHCVQHTPGASFASGLDVEHFHKVFRKGDDPRIDSYSGFFDNGHRKDTGLADFLRQRGVTAVDVVGLALDVCVKFTALDAREEDFQTRVLLEGCRAVEISAGDADRAIEEIKTAGARVVEQEEAAARR